MKCCNCPALCTEGYEYPESYCAVGVPEEETMEYADGETGCTRKSVKKIITEMKECDEKMAEYYGQMGEGMAKLMEDERIAADKISIEKDEEKNCANCKHTECS